MNNYLLDYIQKVRTNKANQNLFYSSSAWFSIIISIFIVLGCIEFIFHLGMENRRIIFEIIFFLFFGGSIYLVFNWIIQSKGLFGNYSDFEIASLIISRLGKFSSNNFGNLFNESLSANG